MNSNGTRNSQAQRLHVGYLIDEIRTGGTERQLLNLLSHLDRRAIEPHLYLLRPPSGDQLTVLRQICATCVVGIGSLRSPSTVPALLRLVRTLRAENVTILQVYFDDSAWIGLLAGLCSGVARVVRTHFNLGTSANDPKYWINRCVNRLFHATMANSSDCKKANRVQYFSPRNKIEVIENGTDCTRSRDACADDGTKLWQIVGLIGNHRGVKQLDMFIQAAALVMRWHPSVVFVVAGEGNHRESLQRLIARCGLTRRALLPGTIVDIAGFLACVDVAVLCSRSEGMPNAVLEYMAARKAIIATPVGGNRQLLQHSRNSIIVPSGDHEQLARAILQLLHNEALARRLAAYAGRSADGQRSFERMAARYQGYYESLVTSPKR